MHTANPCRRFAMQLFDSSRSDRPRVRWTLASLVVTTDRVPRVRRRGHGGLERLVLQRRVQHRHQLRPSGGRQTLARPGDPDRVRGTRAHPTGLLGFGGGRVAPLPHRGTSDSRGPCEGVLRPFLRDARGMSYVEFDVLPDPGHRFSHLVQMLSDPGRRRLFGHESRPARAGFWSKNLEVDGKRGWISRRDKEERAGSRDAISANDS